MHCISSLQNQNNPCRGKNGYFNQPINQQLNKQIFTKPIKNTNTILRAVWISKTNRNIIGNK